MAKSLVSPLFFLFFRKCPVLSALAEHWRGCAAPGMTGMVWAHARCACAHTIPEIRRAPAARAGGGAGNQAYS